MHDLVPASVLTVASLLGIGAAPWLARAERMRRLALAFATGTLLAVAVGHVLPEAFAGSEHGGALFLGGFVAMMLLHQHVLKADPCCGHEHVQHAGLPSFLALATCSINDGVLVFADRAEGIGSPLLWGLAVHKATAAFSLFFVLREVDREGARRHWLYLGAFVAISPATLLAAGHVEGFATWIPHLLAVAGGALLYVVAGSMVPKVEHLARGDVGAVWTSFLLAVAANVALETQLGHAGHDHGPEAVRHSTPDDRIMPPR